MPQPTQPHNLAVRPPSSVVGADGDTVPFSVVCPDEQDGLRDLRTGESRRADPILYEDFEHPAEESILVQSSELTAQSPRVQAIVEDVVEAVEL